MPSVLAVFILSHSYNNVVINIDINYTIYKEKATNNLGVIIGTQNRVLAQAFRARTSIL